MAKNKNKDSVKSRNLVFFVENSNPRIMSFNTSEAAEKFAYKFMKKNPNVNDGYWVDYIITDIKGSILCLDGVEIEKHGA